jgi:hypothetical protein
MIEDEEEMEEMNKTVLLHNNKQQQASHLNLKLPFRERTLLPSNTKKVFLKGFIRSNK